MAGGSLRKKSMKRSSYLTKPSHNSMARSTPSFPRGKFSLVISAVSILCVFVVLSISTNIWSVFGSKPSSNPNQALLDQIYNVEVVNEFPHDPNAFTQGLLYAENDTLFESTGLNGRSSVRKVALRTGKVEAIHKMQNSYFGEGLTLIGERLFQVTWLEKTVLVYDRNNLSKFRKFTHQMQDGWGLATDKKVIFGSDGSSTLYQINPQTLKVIEAHTVKYKGDEVHNLNELEYVNGEVWANVWQTDCIARISSKDGVVIGWILLPNLRKGLIAAGEMSIDVLNGIAWDEKRNRIFVTGKLWPKLYEIKLHKMKTPFKGDIKRLCMPMPVHFRKT
ncbi:glutaminyl-peptide cyclotransferase-like isoform X1 [Olea europaea var. sylvestris]|uniref:glutaminyl-peptide cyclotransferase-like isoform X1 n=1 Tax=Olea europaea var. sylvestris TaxID=158386 RepID=UPI000C1CCCCE|nr:glutaminyl-peptide cyclotransferase-like isoform X1 [Olea europaea var. sylvestris]